MAKKRILFVLTKGNWGGAQRYVFDLSTNLPVEQFEVKVVCGQGRELPEKLKVAGIETIIIPSLGRNMNLWSDLKSFFSLIKIFLRERPDVVHLNSPKASGLGAVAARMAGVKKIISTVHGWTFNEQRPWWQKKIIWLASWISVLLSHFAITITESERDQGLEMPWCKNKIKLIHNGIGNINFLSRESARVKLDVAGVIIGTIAELHKNKGLEYFIEALKNLDNQNWQTIIIGSGEEKNNLKKLIAKLGLKDKIHLVGFIDNAATLLPAFDIFVLPSLKEGLPYAILEAGLAKLPVVATSVGGIPEIISEGGYGFLVPPAKIKPLSQALTFLLEHPSWRQELGQNLQQKITSQYSLERMVEQCVKIYL